MRRRGDPRFSRAYKLDTVPGDAPMLVRGIHMVLAMDDDDVDAARSARAGRPHRDPVALLTRLDREAWRPAIVEQSAREMIDRVVLGELLRGLPVRIDWHRRRGVRP